MKILIFILNLLDHLCLWIYILHLNFLTYWNVLCRICPNNLLNFIGFHCDILFFISSCVILSPLSLASLNKGLLIIFRFSKNPLIVLYILYIDFYFLNLCPDHYFFLLNIFISVVLDFEDLEMNSLSYLRVLWFFGLF